MLTHGIPPDFRGGVHLFFETAILKSDWQKSLRDDFKALGALHGSTSTTRRSVGVDRLVCGALGGGSTVVHRYSVVGGDVYGVVAQEPRGG